MENFGVFWRLYFNFVCIHKNISWPQYPPKYQKPNVKVTVFTVSDHTNMDLEQIVQQLKEDLKERGNIVETMLAKTRDVNKVVKKLEALALEKTKIIQNLNHSLSSKQTLLEAERQ